MPYSFTKIEKDETHFIAIIFSFLILIYFVFIGVFFFVARNLFYLFWTLEENNWDFTSLHGPILLNRTDFFLVIFLAILAAFIHWSITNNNLVFKLLNLLKAKPLDSADFKHKTLLNIIEEIKIATKQNIQIEGFVIPTNALNSFALTDFEGRTVIGVTQGLLDQLNRSQLEAVIAHEAAHIFTRDCLITTVACSFIGIYRELFETTGDSLEGGMGLGLYAVFYYLAYFIILVISYFSYIMTYSMAMFIFRKRELRADAIAVRLSRDPLSLAEALFIINHSLYGSAVSGRNLNAIFIVNQKKPWLKEPEAALVSSHPPLEQRLKILLDMAHADISLLQEKFLGRIY